MNPRGVSRRGGGTGRGPGAGPPTAAFLGQTRPGNGCGPGRSDTGYGGSRQEDGREATGAAGEGRRTPVSPPVPSPVRYDRRNTADVAGRLEQLRGRDRDMTGRLPYPLSRITPPTAGVPRQFSEKGRPSWRRGTGGESRGPCIAGTTPPRIPLPHIDFLPSARSQERARNNHLHPARPGPRASPGPRFSRGLVRRFRGIGAIRGSCPRQAQRAYGACRLRSAVRGGSSGVLRATPCHWTPGRGRTADPGCAVERRSGTGR